MQGLLSYISSFSSYGRKEKVYNVDCVLYFSVLEINEKIQDTKI